MRVIMACAQGLLLLCIGCGGPESERAARLSECVRAVVRSEALGQNGWRQAEEFLQDAFTQTNAVTRINELEAFAAALLSARLDENGYRQWDRALAAVPSLVGSVCSGLSWSGAGVERVYGLRLRLVDWQRRQLELLKPACRSERRSPSDEAWTAWRRCYERAFVSWRMTVDLLEERFEEETRGITSAQRDAVRKQVEKTLGRPMRTAAKVRSERGWETEEYQAVKAGCAAP